MFESCIFHIIVLINSGVRTSQTVPTCLKRGVRIGKERDKRQKIQSAKLPLNTVTTLSVFIIALLYPNEKPGVTKDFLAKDTRKKQA